MADLQVQIAQKWLNNTFGGRTGYVAATEDGIPGNGTINSLTRAAQIALGVPGVDGDFGPTSRQYFENQHPGGIYEQTLPAQEKLIHGIVQCGLWVKGYPAVYGDITQYYTSEAASSIKILKEDAGLSNPDTTCTLNVFLSLLSMNQFKRVENGEQDIRAIQQALNNRYESIIGLAPCDGVYGREMNTALIKALQSEIGATPDGIVGSGTRDLILDIPGVAGEKGTRLTYLFRYSLRCNGYSVNTTSGSWDVALSSIASSFQRDMALNQSGIGDKDTWLSLLLSCGNVARSSVACDTRFEITKSRALDLRNAGYEIVGRYLTGGDFKELRPSEPAAILYHGLKFFPIFQESGTDISYFTIERGARDAVTAEKAALKLGIPKDTVIYFAVDTDPQDPQISSYILPYFGALSATLRYYRVGIYGTRNVCTQVSNAGFSVSSFVSDMSTGFSGNMGFKMPTDWNYDQFLEYKFGDIDLDKVAYSGKIEPVSSIDPVYPGVPIISNDGLPMISECIDKIRKIEEYVPGYFAREIIGVTPSSKDIMQFTADFIRNNRYNGVEWIVTTLGPVNSNWVDYVNVRDSSLESFFISKPEFQDDGPGGRVDLPHLMATFGVYCFASLTPNQWGGWAADLATMRKDVSDVYMTKLQAALLLGSEEGHFDIADVCSDADAIMLNQMSSEYTDSMTPLSDMLTDYYLNSTKYKNRMTNFLIDLGSERTFSGLYRNIRAYLTDILFTASLVWPIPTSDEKDNLAWAFASYLYEHIGV